MSGIIDSIRYGEDFANAANCVIGESPYQVYLVTSAGESIDIDTLGDPVPIANYTRITIADGYRSYLTLGNSLSDGYLYPMVIEISTKVLLASGESFTQKQVKIGPICLPYSVFVIDGSYLNGGISPEVFSPQMNSSNMNYWIQIIGPGITGGNGNGSFYSIEEIEMGVGKKNIAGDVCYYLIAEASGTAPPGTS